jgi:argininosuccinate lyase
MPLYTHYQPALPITYGHYLSGVGLALSRDLRQIQDAVEPDRCPLGAGAGGGACIGINTARTAQLLGFTDSVLHSVEAVASRDLVLRLLSALAILGVTLSRAATDLLLWTTEEFKLVEFPDNLAGSSSMLPQKRNPFLLEHIKGRSAACLGAFTSAAVGMHATPFSNSVAVGTEAVKPIWTALNEMTEAVLMLRLVIAGTRPCSERMQVRAEKGLTAATELANTLVEKSGLSFRQAHKRVGQLVSALDARESLPDAAQRLFLGSGVKLDPETLDPARVAERAEFGGGPGSGSAARILDHLTRDWTHSLARLSSQRARWSHGSKELELAVFHISREQFAFTSR